jgi:hypothetical protein
MFIGVTCGIWELIITGAWAGMIGDAVYAGWKANAASGPLGEVGTVDKSGVIGAFANMACWTELYPAFIEIIYRPPFIICGRKTKATTPAAIRNQLASNQDWAVDAAGTWFPVTFCWPAVGFPPPAGGFSTLVGLVTGGGV